MPSCVDTGHVSETTVHSVVTGADHSAVVPTASREFRVIMRSRVPPWPRAAGHVTIITSRQRTPMHVCLMSACAPLYLASAGCLPAAHPGYTYMHTHTCACVAALLGRRPAGYPLAYDRRERRDEDPLRLAAVHPLLALRHEQRDGAGDRVCGVKGVEVGRAVLRVEL